MIVVRILAFALVAVVSAAFLWIFFRMVVSLALCALIGVAQMIVESKPSIMRLHDRLEVK